jgi:hypothetical protein
MTFVERSTPYPWPWDGGLQPERVHLVVTGWDPAWMTASIGVGNVVECILRLAELVGSVTTVEHRGGSRRPVAFGPPPGSLGGAHVVAEGIDAFYGSALEPRLRRCGSDRILFAGFGLETTVHSTLRRANDVGLECLVVRDACAPLDPTLVPAALSMIEMSGGIFGAVAWTDDVLAALRPTRSLLTVPVQEDLP